MVSLSRCRSNESPFFLSHFISFHSSSYPGIREFHMVNVSNNSTIRVDHKIDGAIHVTQCHNVQLHLQSFHQLRIHESSNLQIHIKDGEGCGGSILEDTSNLVFYVNDTTIMKNGEDDNNDKALLDVKDFNWLRNNIPSPNFRVEAASLVSIESTSTSGEGGSEATVDPPAATTNNNNNVEAVNPTTNYDNNMPAVTAALVEDEESDEDEL